MASPESQNNTDTLSNKINKALTLWDDSYSLPYSQASYNSERRSFADSVEEVGNDLKLLKYHECTVSAGSPFQGKIITPIFLTEEELYEAILYAKIIDDFEEFKAIRQTGEELAWVSPGVGMWLVSPYHVLCIMDTPIFEAIRETGRNAWAILKKRVERNLVQEFSTLVSVQDQKKLASNSQLSVALPCSAPSKSPAAVPTTPLITDEVKAFILDELNSITNLDPFLRRQFEFDLKVFADRSIHYWRERLDLMRNCTKSAVPSSAQLTSLIETISNLEKVVKQNEACMASFAEQLKPKQAIDDIGKKVGNLRTMVLEQMMEHNKLHMEIVASAISSLIDSSADQLSGMKKLSDAVIATGDSISPAVSKLELIVERIGTEVGAIVDTFFSLKKASAGQIDGMEKTLSDTVKATGESTSPDIQKFNLIAERTENQVGDLADTVSTFKKASADQLADMKRLTTAVKTIGDSLSPVVHQLEVIVERNENQVGVLTDTISSLKETATGQVAGKKSEEKTGGDTSIAPVKVTLQTSEPVPEISTDQIDALKEGTKVNEDDTSSSEEWCHLSDISSRHDESLSLQDPPLDSPDKREWWFSLFEDISLLPETLQRSRESCEPISADLYQLQNNVILKMLELRDAIKCLQKSIGMV